MTSLAILCHYLAIEKLYKVCSKSTEKEAVFTKTKINNEWNVDFFLNSRLGIQQTCSNEFSISRSTSETPILIW